MLRNGRLLSQSCHNQAGTLGAGSPSNNLSCFATLYKYVYRAVVAYVGRQQAIKLLLDEGLLKAVRLRAVRLLLEDVKQRKLSVKALRKR